MAEGEKVVQQTEGLPADAAKANPEFQGKTITAGVFSSDKFSLGCRPIRDNGDFYISLSSEQLEKMNADVILLAAQDQNGPLGIRYVISKIGPRLKPALAGQS